MRLLMVMDMFYLYKLSFAFLASVDATFHGSCTLSHCHPCYRVHALVLGTFRCAAKLGRRRRLYVIAIPINLGGPPDGRYPGRCRLWLKSIYPSCANVRR